MPTGNRRAAGNPRLAAGVRLGFDYARGGPVLLAPESVTTLNDSGAAIVRLCDGTRNIEQITAALGEEYEGVQAADIEVFLTRLRTLRCLSPIAVPPATEAPVTPSTT